MRTELIENSGQITDFIVSVSTAPILLVDKKQYITDCNTGFLKLFSLTEKPCGSALSKFLTPGGTGVDTGAGIQQFVCNPKTGVHGVLTAHRLPISNGMLLWCERLHSTNNEVVERLAILNNEFITIQRELDKNNHRLRLTQKELAEKVVQLEAALSQVKKLQGIIPICMYCKKIRDDREMWLQMEHYIQEHSEAEFSHGICPECMESKYGEEVAK
jgi:hypothetical protein